MLNDARERYFRFYRNGKKFLTARRWQIGPYIVLKSNRKSGIASSFMRFPPYLILYILPVWPEMAVGGPFSPVMRVLRCVLHIKLAQSVTRCQLTTGILLPVQLEVNI